MSHFLKRRSTWLFVATALVLVGIKLLFDNYTGDFPLREQAAAFTWPLVLGILGIGLAGLFADRASGLPDPLADLPRERRGILIATLTGIVYGVITIGMYVYDWRQDPAGPDAEWVHLALPWSVAFYTFGAIFLEFLLRLGALCILFWLIHVVIFRHRFRAPIFWVLAAIVALYEILPYMMPDIEAGRWANLAHVAIEPLYLSNVFEGWLLWRYGWFTPIVFRLAFYLVWHILFGGLAGPYFGH